MEILSLGEAAIDVIDLGDMSQPHADTELADELEISDVPHGLVFVMPQTEPGGFELPESGADLEVSDIPGAIMLALNEPAPEEIKEKDWEHDGAHEHFIKHLKKKVDQIPAHSGQTSVGLERAMSYLKSCDAEISKAVRSDFDNKIDEHEAEAIRENISDMICKLEEALADMTEKKSKKRKKSASVRVSKEVVARIGDGNNIQYFVEVSQGEHQELLPVNLAEPEDDQVRLFVNGEAESGLTKEAGTGKIVLYVDPWMQAITRLLINAHVSAGRNIEQVYGEMKKKYGFTNREELGIQEILMQKGLPIFKDFGRTGEDGGQFSDGKGIEFQTTYYA